MQKVKRSDGRSRQTDEFRRTVRGLLVVLERLAAHAGVESDELDQLVVEFFDRPDTGGSVDSLPEEEG